MLKMSYLNLKKYSNTITCSAKLNTCSTIIPGDSRPAHRSHHLRRPAVPPERSRAAPAAAPLGAVARVPRGQSDECHILGSGGDSGCSPLSGLLILWVRVLWV